MLRSSHALHGEMLHRIGIENAGRGGYDPGMTINRFSPRGIYPMQYAFFGRDGRLDRAAMGMQVEAAVRAGAHGVAVLGLATEVGKLSIDERHALVQWVAEILRDRLPLAVTVNGTKVEDQVRFANYAADQGAAWVILQPPQRDVEETFLIDFFGRVADRVKVPVAIQNAPEYLGVGLSAEGINALHDEHPNFSILKGEGPVLGIRRVIEQTQGKVSVFNGRAGLELIDNLRAGCAGMIPATDTFDRQARIFEYMQSGREEEAESLYREILPTIVFTMQSVDHLVCYAKRIAALRLGLSAVCDRSPGMLPTDFGIACVERYAKALGPLPH
jgi:4-hydroxy-tetrahydrodipicolinate synthase